MNRKFPVKANPRLSFSASIYSEESKVRRFVQCTSCSLARLVGGLSLVVAVYSAAQGCDATSAPVKSGLLVDWNQDFIIYAHEDTENADRPSLPQLSLDDNSGAMSDESASDEDRGDDNPPQVADDDARSDAMDDNAISGDDANSKSSDETANRSDADVAGNPSNDTNSDDCMRYRYGHLGSYYGENGNVNPNPSQATDGNAKSEDATKTGETSNAIRGADVYKPGETNDSSTKSGDLPKSGDTDATKNGSPHENGLDNNSDSSKTDAPATTDASPGPETTPNTDASPKNDAKSDNSAPGDSTTETTPAAGSSPVATLEDFHRYRDQPIENQYGDNADGAQEDDGNSSTDEPSSDDGKAMSDEVSDDETAGDDASGHTGSLADAMLAAISRATDEVLSSHGLKISWLTDLLPRM
jgi:hypothetical protein